jgi:hypothetical protein
LAERLLRAGVGRETPLDRVDNLRNNWWWWLVNSAVAVRPDAPLGILYPKGQMDVPAFLSASEQAEAEAEWKALSGVPTGPNAPGSVVLEWAKQHRDDPHVPEPLHLVVRATRYGSTDKQSGEFPRQLSNYCTGVIRQVLGERRRNPAMAPSAN